jgi:hypothetical protein
MRKISRIEVLVLLIVVAPLIDRQVARICIGECLLFDAINTDEIIISSFRPSAPNTRTPDPSSGCHGDSGNRLSALGGNIS